MGKCAGLHGEHALAPFSGLRLQALGNQPKGCCLGDFAAWSLRGFPFITPFQVFQVGSLQFYVDFLVFDLCLLSVVSPLGAAFRFV